MPKHKLAAILLAAGCSSRLGRAKQLVIHHGETLVRRSARLLLELQLDVVVVTGCESTAVVESLEGLPLTVVHNPEWEQGMGTSIACGAKHIAPASEGVLVMPIDLWRLGIKDLLAIIESWEADISSVCATSWFEDKTLNYGPPSIFPCDLIHELQCMHGIKGAKVLIDKERQRLELIHRPNAAWDLDSPADLQQLLSQNERCPSN
ncbi:MAG: nucleotidyltransferase family protein [Xanthomonadales bacterium]|jgi:molybdenum cofactor cytidylyltransferase|nr:nucleotidyltransferase family protein [Xanthomonadales bacterium]MDH3923107.1 nucleotidyltransferase family protein [Xanthomonadales bacterium]MDH4000468.1 nucleotidyltransferase family protein [Xanthomonadales bacterium]